jgi:hypothetical protein
MPVYISDELLARPRVVAIAREAGLGWVLLRRLTGEGGR